MSHKDVRPLLSSLSSDSLISLQEVPKGNDRNPARTFYLWYVLSARMIACQPTVGGKGLSI